MRRVDRSSVPFPERLLAEKITVANQQQMNGQGDIQSSVYAHRTVKESLTKLYFDKCYICEDKAINGTYDVEHYLPKEHFKHLAYSWSNLHKVCKICNLAKENKEFRILDEEQKFSDIKLLDPSSVEYSITDCIRYNIDSKVEVKLEDDGSVLYQKALYTANLLNGNIRSDTGELKSHNTHDMPNRRTNRSNAFLRYFSVESKLAVKKQRIEQIANSLDNYERPTQQQQVSEDIEIYDDLKKADLAFFVDSAPFSTSCRVQLRYVLKIDYPTFSALLRKMEQALEI